MPNELDPQFMQPASAVGASTQAPTAASEWRSSRTEGFTVQLPSGNVARVRRSMDILQLLKTGRVPNKLIKLITAMMDQQKAGQIPIVEAGDADEETIMEMMSFIDTCVASIMISPPCHVPPREKDESNEDYQNRAPSWIPPEGSISIFDLSPEDRMFLFSVAQGGTTDLELFRNQQAAVVVGSSDSKAVPRSTKRTGGTKK